MLKHAKVEDYWNRVYKRDYEILIKDIDLQGLRGLSSISVNKGIFAICGLNGVGKSTIISALKDILGLKLNIKDYYRIDKHKYNATIVNGSSEIKCDNNDGNRFKEKYQIDDNLSLYLDYEQSLEILRILGQENLDEYVNQFGDYELTTEELGEINYIVGREYSRCTITEINDDEETIPYFRVECNGICYDSLKMGLGEHVLFYFYWAIKSMEKCGIIIIEEPENFISIKSQEKLMNYIAKRVSKVGITVFIATHSPYIIKKIPLNNIKVVNRYNTRVNIINGSEINALNKLGLDIRNKGIIFVEDYMAELFLRSILRDSYDFILEEYSLESVGGETHITERLKFQYSDKFQYKIVGIYDGDMRTKLSKSVKEKLNWKYAYLPGDFPVEEEFRSVVKKNVVEFIKRIEISEYKVINALESTDGEDYHDWFINMSKILNIDISTLFSVMYKMWAAENKERITLFLNELDLLKL